MSAPDADKKKDNPAGRVRHDPSGRAVWEWAKESGRHAIESTSRLLKRLDLAGLSLADEEKEKEKKQQQEREVGSNPYGQADPPIQSRRSFDPYDNRAPPRRGATTPAKKPAQPRITQPVRPAHKPGFLARLLGRKY